MTFFSHEKYLERYVVEEMRKRGLEIIKLKSEGQRAYPDRQFFIPGGKPLLIEFKRPGSCETSIETIENEQQQRKIKRLKELGYNVEVCNDEQSAFRAVSKAMEAARVSKKGG